jgi:hypothetical protein
MQEVLAVVCFGLLVYSRRVRTRTSRDSFWGVFDFL